MPEKTFQKLDQEKVYQILSKGVIFTMEDDLKDAMQSQKIKTNLIPKQVKIEQVKKELSPRPIFVEKVHFDPFQKLEAPILLPQNRDEILEKIKKQKIDLDVILQKVDIIKEQKNIIEKQEQSASDSLQKHNFEEQRWKIEEKFKQQQDLQWQKEEEIEKTQLALSKIDSNSKKGEVAVVVQEEQKIEEQLRDIEKKIQNTTDAIEKRKLEQERREIDQKRQVQEKKRWEMEKPQDAMQEQDIIDQIRLKAKEREQEIVQKQVVGTQVVQEEQSMDKEQFLRIQEENRKEAIEKLKQIAQQEQKKMFTGKLNGPLLKEEILKKFTKVSPEEEAQRQDFLSRINNESFGKLRTGQPNSKLKGPEEGVVFHPMIKKASLFGKVVTRVLIVFLIIAVLAGAYFGITKLMKKEIVSPLPNNNIATTTENPTVPVVDWPVIATSTVSTNSTSSSQADSGQATTTPAVIVPPVSLIFVSKNNILAESNLDVLKNNIPYNLFEQISVFNTEQQVFLSAMQFFEEMGVVLPQEINQENGTSTILVFSSKFGNRLGFVLQTENTANIKASFLVWENQAETSTAPIFDLMGKKLPAINKIFKNLKYKTTYIRYQTFAKTDLGVCYAVHKNYFIFASSLEQMQRIVDKLP